MYLISFLFGVIIGILLIIIFNMCYLSYFIENLSVDDATNIAVINVINATKLAVSNPNSTIASIQGAITQAYVNNPLAKGKVDLSPYVGKII